VIKGMCYVRIVSFFFRVDRGGHWAGHSNVNLFARVGDCGAGHVGVVLVVAVRS
jgi:hypothetical protein